MEVHTLIDNKISPHKSWEIIQSKTTDHKIAVLLYTIICGLSVIKPSIAFWGPIIFFIITVVPKMGGIVSYMIFSLIVTTIASLIHPMLGVIVSALFFIIKISNFISNLKAILAGIFVYLMPAIIVGKFGYYLYYLTYPIDKVLYMLSINYEIIYFINAFIIGLFSGLILHIILKWLYRNEYSAKSALSIMGSSPLIILLMIIPFIINAVGDLIDDVLHAGGSMADDFVSFRDGYNNDHGTNFNTQDLNGDGINDNIHSVKGHYRSTPSGGVTYVDPYIRTDPNSIVSDNISYKG